MTRRTLATSFPQVTMTSPDGSTRTITLNQTSPVWAWERPMSTSRASAASTTGRYATLLPVVVAVGNSGSMEFYDVRATEAKLKPLVEASGGGLMWPSGNPDPEFHSVRPGRAAGGSDWIGLRRNEGTQWLGSTSCRCCRGSWWRWRS